MGVDIAHIAEAEILRQRLDADDGATYPRFTSSANAKNRLPLVTRSTDEPPLVAACRANSFLLIVRFHNLVSNYLISEPCSLRNAITLTMSSFFLKPGKSIFVPGTVALGFLRYSISVASSQVIPELLFASE